MITVEDKDPAVLWTENRLFGMSRWLGRLKEQVRWSVCEIAMATVLIFYRVLLNRCLPRSLLQKGMEVQENHIPYVYRSIKLKCFCGEIGCARHSCVKPQHACERNICSFKKLPGRPTFQKIGRCLRHLMNTHSKGWNFSDLTHSAAELKQAYHETEPRELTEKTRCIRCSCQMNRPSIIAADAGQAYEELNLPHG